MNPSVVDVNTSANETEIRKTKDDSDVIIEKKFYSVLCFLAAADYGVCCANMDELVKPGACPPNLGSRRKSEGQTNDGTQSFEEIDVRCGANCDHDLQCPSTQKCCMSPVCGQHCVQPTNLTGRWSVNFEQRVVFKIQYIRH